MATHRILIVDDEPKISALISFVLEQTKRFEVRCESRSALALNAAREFRPDLVLLDVDMPGKDGGDVAAEIGKDPELSGVPILFLTSLVSAAEAGEREVMKSGMPFLSKPVKVKVLIDTVDRLLASRIHAA